MRTILVGKLSNAISNLEGEKKKRRKFILSFRKFFDRVNKALRFDGDTVLDISKFAFLSKFYDLIL